MNLSKEILKSEAEIAERVSQLGRQITADHEGKELAVLGILKGSFVFVADLIRQIRLPQQVGFLEITHSEKSEFLTEIMFYSSFRVEGTHLLIVEDILNFARETGVPYSSRGSAASSLVAHCLGITSPDPLRLNLYFERFLSLERRDPPDIDLDLCSRRRDEVINYSPAHPAPAIGLRFTWNTDRRRSTGSRSTGTRRLGSAPRPSSGRPEGSLRLTTFSPRSRRIAARTGVGSAIAGSTRRPAAWSAAANRANSRW